MYLGTLQSRRLAKSSRYGLAISPRNHDIIKNDQIDRILRVLNMGLCNYQRHLTHAQDKKRFQEGNRDILFSAGLTVRERYDESKSLDDGAFTRSYQWLFSDAPYDWMCAQVLKGFQEPVKEVLGREVMEVLVRILAGWDDLQMSNQQYAAVLILRCSYGRMHVGDLPA